MKIIGIVGTAKNTGKTTTLSALLGSVNSNGKKTALTGIGYDGEEIDNITLLPKPRLLVEKEMIVATSENCISNSDVQFNVLYKTGLRTALGEIFIIQITRPGLLVIAGPNKKNDLISVIEQLKAFSPDYLFVDGSLNRISPMSVVDEIIFTTGAARSTNLEQLVSEMESVEKIFRFEKCEKRFSTLNNTIVFTNSEQKELTFSTFVDRADVENIFSYINSKTKKIVLPGLISDSAIINLLGLFEDNGLTNIEIIINSPLHFLMGSELSQLKNLTDKLKKSGIKFSYLNKPELKIITINPFYPKEHNFNFEFAYVDKSKFIDLMRERLTTPIYNVRDAIPAFPL